MERNKKNWDDLIIIVALIVITIVIVYIVTVGKINLIQIIDETNKKTRNEAIRKHERLKIHLDKQKDLKEKLTRKFKRIYFAIRLLFVLGWASGIAILYYYKIVTDLSSFLNYSQATVLLFILLYFLTFGNLTNLNTFLNMIKSRLENWIWGKHINIDKIITINEEELKSLESNM